MARKLVILVRTLGYNVSLSDVTCEPMIPCDSTKKLSPDELRTYLEGFDQAIHEKMQSALGRDKTLRYVAQFQASPRILRTSLEEVDRESPLGQLRGTENYARVQREQMGTWTHFEPGAGGQKTSSALRVALTRMLPELDMY